LTTELYWAILALWDKSHKRHNPKRPVWERREKRWLWVPSLSGSWSPTPLDNSAVTYGLSALPEVWISVPQILWAPSSTTGTQRWAAESYTSCSQAGVAGGDGDLSHATSHRDSNQSLQPVRIMCLSSAWYTYRTLWL